MPHIRTPQIEIYYEQAGIGPPVLFISGTGGDLRLKPNVFDGPLSRHFQVTAYDQRGLGQTDKPDKPYTMADYADDAAHLLDALGLDQVHVIGVSFGGMVAQEFALRHQSRIRRLVLACTSPGGEGGASFAFHELALTGIERAAHMIPISDLRHDAQWAARHPDQYQRMIDMAARDPYADEPGRLEGARRQLEARKGHDTWMRLGQLQMPVMIAAGEYDGIAPKSIQMNLHRQIKDAELHFFDGGHLFLIQDQRAMPAIIQFLKFDSR